MNNQLQNTISDAYETLSKQSDLSPYNGDVTQHIDTQFLTEFRPELVNTNADKQVA